MRPLMTASAIMLFSPICVAATTRHSNSSGTVSVPDGTSEMFRLNFNENTELLKPQLHTRKKNNRLTNLYREWRGREGCWDEPRRRFYNRYKHANHQFEPCGLE